MDHPLTAYRHRHALSLAALASRAGTTKANLWRIENGAHGASVPLMHRIVAATGGEVTIDALLASRPDAPPAKEFAA